MSHLYAIPQWFFGIDVFLEFVFAIVTALVAVYALKMYKLCEQREAKLLGTGFILISISYVLKATLNLFILNETIEGVRVLEMETLSQLGALGVYLHFLFFIAGLVTLAYLTFQIQSKRAYTLLLVTNVAVITSSTNKILSFNLLSLLLIGYILTHYILTYAHQKNKGTLIVLMAFLSLFISEISFIITTKYYQNYLISHYFELAAYLLMLISLGLAMRNKCPANKIP